jgi:hypothetical protein
MTIGIGVFGPNAGLAVLKALSAVEKVSRGAIGGFAAYAVIKQDGTVTRQHTQRGGTQTLFVDDEGSKIAPPSHVAEAPFAAIISSGPDRPEPLSQFVAAESGVGLVTGHRFPNEPGENGMPINSEILSQMKRGLSAQQAAEVVMDINPESDAGVVAIDLQGRIFSRNSDRVARRFDIGAAQRKDPASGAGVAVLYNSIYPLSSIAELVVEIAMETMVPVYHSDAWLTVNKDTPIEFGKVDAVIVDQEMVARKIITSDVHILQGRHSCAAIYLNARVIQEDQELGHILFEPYTVVDNAKIVSLNGQESLSVGFRRSKPNLK